jgi:hypothetical protein
MKSALFTALEIFLDSSFKGASSQEDAPAALKALYTDIRPQPHHLPLIAAAGVDLAEFDHVAELYLRHYSPTSSDGIGQITVNFFPEFFSGAPGGGGEILPFRGVEYLPRGINNRPLSAGIRPVAHHL